MNALPINSARPPIIVSAGMPRERGIINHLAEEETIAAQVIGAVSRPEWPGNSENGAKNVFYWDEENQAAYNSIGLENPGKEKLGLFLPDCIKKMHDFGQIAFINIVALGHEDPKEALTELAEWGVEMGADGIEVDASCANHAFEKDLLCNDPDHTGEIIESIREIIGYEAILSVKFSALSIHKIIKYHGLKLPFDIAVTMNAVGHQPSPINPNTGKPTIEVNDGYASRSGPAINNEARKNLEYWLGWYDGYSTDPKRVPYQVISLGGVDDGFKVYDRHHNMGAILVGGTQAFYRAADPRRVAQRWAQEYIQANPNF